MGDLEEAVRFLEARHQVIAMYRESK